MSRVLVDQLRALAHRLGGGTIAGRPDSTRKFWLIAGQLRAALPPLLLAVRTGSPQHRIGYLLTAGSAWPNRLRLIENEHGAGNERTCLYLHGEFREIPGISWAKVVDLNSLNEIQAARLIAEDDLDLLVDIDGGMLQAMPAMIALHPARRLAEAAFVPVITGDSATMSNEPFAPADPHAVIDAARRALDALPEAPSTTLDSPATLNARLNRGIQMHQAGELAAAHGVYRDVLAHVPGHPVAAYLLGQLLFQQGRLDESIAALRAAVESAPEFRDAHYTLAQRLVDAGHGREAIVAYRRTLDLTPGFAAGWSGLGLASLQVDDNLNRTAVSYLQRAVALEPESAQWSFNLGAALQRQANLVEARNAYQRALQLDPLHHDALFNFAAVAQESGDYSGAINAYRQVLDRRPESESAYTQLGTCLLLTGNVDAWLENFRRYRQHCRESLAMAVYGLETSTADGDPVAYADWRDRILAGTFPATDAQEFIRNWEQLLFLLLHVDVDRGALAQWYRRYDESAIACYGAPTAVQSTRRPGPLRIGYLSGDLRDHVMGRMIFELVSHHDRVAFQPYLYSLSAAHDEWTARFRTLGNPFVELASLPPAAAAARIRDDDIDILVDCSGHTRGAQQGILALKPARVVVTHIATPGPIGLSAIDYKLTDEFAESADAQQFMIERLWPVRGGVFPWHRYPPPGELSRAELGIAPNAFVCGAFVSLMKLSPRCLALWRRILDRIPRALIACSPAEENWRSAYLRWFDAHGIGRDRIVFIPNSTDERRALARYRVLDVALDPMPCGNVNGTMESLAMGVPVVTLAGIRHGELLGNALLKRFGVTDTIAADENAYFDLACRLADDATWSAQLRERIRKATERSPVWDSVSRVRDLEATFEEMLARCESAPAR